MSRFLSLGLLCCCVTPALLAQQLTPRDAFWSASDLVSVHEQSRRKGAPCAEDRSTHRAAA